MVVTRLLGIKVASHAIERGIACTLGCLVSRLVFIAVRVLVLLGSARRQII